MESAININDETGTRREGVRKGTLWRGSAVPCNINGEKSKMNRMLIAAATVLALVAGATCAQAQSTGALAQGGAGGQNLGMAPGNTAQPPAGVDPQIWQAITTGRTGAYGLPPAYWQEIVGGSGGGGS